MGDDLPRSSLEGGGRGSPNAWVSGVAPVRGHEVCGDERESEGDDDVTDDTKTEAPRVPRSFTAVRGPSEDVGEHIELRPTRCINDRGTTIKAFCLPLDEARELDTELIRLANEDPVCQVHDADDAVPGRICGRPMPCREHGST
jgi:hypothetical protein